MIRTVVHIVLLAMVGIAALATANPADGADLSGTLEGFPNPPATDSNPPQSGGPARGPRARAKPELRPRDRAPSAVVAAVERALAVPGARLAAVDAEPASGAGRGCAPGEVTVPRAVEGSGRVAVKVTGTRAGGARCESWSWVRVRVVADVAVTRRALRAGEALGAAVVTETREISLGHPPADPAAIAAGAVAAYALPAGALVESDAASVPTARPGDPVKVILTTAGLAIEQSGRAVPCVRGRSCAVLPSGKHVEGDLVDGRLVVTMP